MSDKARRRPGVWRRIGRAIGDSGLTIGMSEGMSRRRGGSGHGTTIANAALRAEGARDYDDRTAHAGLLDRVPGWLVLAFAALVVIGVLVFTDWAR